MQTNLVSIKDGLYESWKKELKVEEGISALNGGLKKLGLLDLDEFLDQYRDIEPWHRGGAETYIATAYLKTNLQSINLIAKALVSLSIRPEIQLNRWLSNRKILESHGVLVPFLYATDPGTIYEEYIDISFSSILKKLDNEKLQYLGFLASKLDYLGFLTVSFERDLRVKNNRIYYVDFGQDLGSPSSKKTNNSMNRLSEILSKAQFQIACLGTDEINKQPI